jgi:hypothetical protein
VSVGKIAFYVWFIIKLFSCSCIIKDGSENNNLTLNQSESTETLLELQSENNVPSDLENKSKEEIIMLAPNDQEDAQKDLQCDDNQNNVNNRMLLMQNFNVNAAGERIIVNLKQLLALYAKLKRQLMEFTEVKISEQSSYKAKCEEMSSQVGPSSIFYFF